MAHSVQRVVERCEVAKENGGIMGKKVKFFLFFREIGIFLESSNSIYKLRKYLIVAEGKVGCKSETKVFVMPSLAYGIKALVSSFCYPRSFVELMKDTHWYDHQFIILWWYQRNV